MDFFTPVELPSGMPRLSQSDELLLMGSCFATHIGECLTHAKFRTDVNPFGVLYNPLSISAALREVVADKVYTEDDLFFFRGCWHSSMHHGDFSASSAPDALRHINTRLRAAHARIHRLDCLMLTFGTAWVYEQAGHVVANCHKQPDTLFTRRRLSVQEIVADYTSLLSRLTVRNPKLRVLLTVSPIRHVRDGMHANQLSKAVLLMAVDQLCEAFPGQVFYFPAYEFLLDELRDYRFYAEDMVHPSAQAVGFVWEKFVQLCLSDEARDIMQETERVRKALSHKPFRPDSAEHKHFLEQIVLKIDRLNQKYPYLDFQNEKEICLIQLKE